MDAIAHRDAAALAGIVAPEFVLRMPGEPETRRAAFLAEVAAIPGEIVSVTGEAITAHRTGDTGIVRGRQIAKLKIEGAIHEVRGTFVDVFARRGDRWVLVLAINVNDS
jgi:ketosteroid isomerase-like protein